MLYSVPISPGKNGRGFLPVRKIISQCIPIISLDHDLQIISGRMPTNTNSKNLTENSHIF